MIKKYGFGYFLKYYGLIQILIIGLLLFFFREKIFLLVVTYLKIQQYSSLYDLIHTGIYVGLAGLYIYFVFTFLRERRYHYLTGRNYSSDSSKFQMTYSALVFFWLESHKHRLDPGTLPKGNWYDTKGIIFGKARDMTGSYRVIKRDSDDPGNAMCFALPKSGKTTAQAVPQALCFDGSVLLNDYKGDILRWTKGKRKIKIFSPDTEEGSCHYDMLGDIRKQTPSDRKTSIESLSMALIPDDPKGDGQYFVDGARDYFCAITLFSLEEDINTPFPVIIDRMINGNYADIATMIDEQGSLDARSYTSSYIGSNERNVAGCYNALIKAMRPLTNGALRTLFSPADKAHMITSQTLEDGFDVYVECPQEKADVYSPVITAFMQNMMYALTRRGNDALALDNKKNKDFRPVLIILDEFAQMSFNWDIANLMFSTLRSRTVSISCFCQSASQLSSKYGDDNANTLLDTCEDISIMSATTPKNRQMFSDLIGKEKILRSSNSLSNAGNKYRESAGRTTSEDREYFIAPEDWGDLDTQSRDGKKRKVVISFNGKHIIAEKTFCYENGK